MKRKILSYAAGCLLILSLTGCAFMNRLLPGQVDAAGNPIPGTHAANVLTETATGALPMGSLALNALLLVWNSIEKYKSKKTSTGLLATVKALNQVKNDPALIKQWEQIKTILENNHDAAGVTATIKNILAKI